MDGEITLASLNAGNTPFLYVILDKSNDSIRIQSADDATEYIRLFPEALLELAEVLREAHNAMHDK